MIRPHLPSFPSPCLPLAVLLAMAAPALAQQGMRPAFHFTPEQNWMNDPNGLVWHDGEYHLFYQHNPHGDTWGHMSWGHAVSGDLMTWEHLPLAIPEKDGVMAFSGSAVVDSQNTSGFGGDGIAPMVAIYTGHHSGRQDQRLAYSLDRGRTWTMYEGNPVLDIGKADFRDPKVFRHADSDRWIMAITLPHERRVSFYGSDDLKDWEHLSDFGPAGAVDGVWECPDLFEVPIEGTERKRWVLTVSVSDQAHAGGSGMQYFTGVFDGTTFTADGVDRNGEDFLEGEVVADFESVESGYDGWEIEGEAFGERPSPGTEERQQPVYGFLGEGLVNSYVGGDEPTGTMLSPVFEITRPWLNFLVGGGEDPEHLAVRLWIGDEIIHTATGRNSERLDWVAWPVERHIGREARIELVDEASGDWGHLLFDHLILSDEAARPRPDTARWLDHGPDLYAGVTWDSVPDGTPTFIAWMTNLRYAGLTPTGPWRGAMTLPRELSLRESGGRKVLVQRPSAALERWRGEPLEIEHQPIESANSALEDLAGAHFDLELDFEPGEADEVGIRLRVGEDEETVVGWSRGERVLFVDRSRSANSGFHEDFAPRRSAPLEPHEGRVAFRVVLDEGSLEVFADDGALVMTHLLFAAEESLGLGFHHTGAEGARVSATIHPLARPE